MITSVTMGTINNGTFGYGYKFSKLSFQIEQTTISILIYRNKYPCSCDLPIHHSLSLSAIV